MIFDSFVGNLKFYIVVILKNEYDIFFKKKIFIYKFEYKNSFE